jgi:hypothetical protein
MDRGVAGVSGNHAAIPGLSAGRGASLRSCRARLMSFRRRAPNSCRSLCRVAVYWWGRHGNHRNWRLRNLSRSAGRLVRTVIGRPLGRPFRRRCLPVDELRRSSIPYHRRRRRLVCGQSRIRDPAWLKHVVKAEPEEAAYEHTDSKIQCDGRPSALGLRIPRAHGPQGTSSRKFCSGEHGPYVSFPVRCAIASRARPTPR